MKTMARNDYQEGFYDFGEFQLKHIKLMKMKMKNEKQTHTIMTKRTNTNTKAMDIIFIS